MRLQRASVRLETGELGDQAEHAGWGPAVGSQLSQPSGVVGLTQLAAVRAPEQRMMDEARHLSAPEQGGKSHLSPCAGEEILTADDGIHSEEEIIHGDGELIGPLAEPITDQQVTALLSGLLCDLSEAKIGEALDAGLHHNAPSGVALAVTRGVTTGAGVAELVGCSLTACSRDLSS